MVWRAKVLEVVDMESGGDSLEGAGTGDYFSEKGEYLGNDKIDDKKVYVAREGSYKANENGGNTIQKSGISELKDGKGNAVNIDGVTNNFDFSSATAQIQGLFPPGQLLDITYYKNFNDALAETNKITNIANYSNLGYPNTQNIFVRVDSQINNECLGLGHHITLNVEKIPIVLPQILKSCDDNQDGFLNFDTTNLQTNLLNGLANVVVTYTDQSGNPIVMSNPFYSNSNTINVKIKNNFGKLCEFNSTVQFVVETLPQAFPIPTDLTAICYDEINANAVNGKIAFDTSLFQSTILGSQTGMTVAYFDENNQPLSSPLPNPFIFSNQNIKVVVTNLNNTNCTAQMTIPLLVYPIPKINLTGSELICSDNPSFTKNINAGISAATNINNYNYEWFLDGATIPNQNNYNLNVNKAGTYTVKVTNANNCSKVRTITVTASNLAKIENKIVLDLADENSIEILLTPLVLEIMSIVLMVKITKAQMFFLI